MQHIICDDRRSPDQESDMLIDSTLLMNSEFNLGHWYTKHLVRLGYGSEEQLRGVARFAPMTTPLTSRIQDLLTETFDPDWKTLGDLYRFTCITKQDGLVIWDRFTHFRSFLPYGLALWEYFDVVNWYRTAIHRGDGPIRSTWKDPDRAWRIPSWLFTGDMDGGDSTTVETSDDDSINSLDLFGAQIPKGTYPALERNAGTVKDFKRMVPKPVVVVVHINGHPVRALLDTGSLADFMSSTLAEQLGVTRVELAKPLTVQLAVQGSCSKVNYGTKARLEYQCYGSVRLTVS